MTTAALVLLAVLGYTYLGYPIAIGLLAALTPRRRPEQDDAGADELPLPTLSICLPVYNGAAYLPAKLESLLGQDYPADRFEILIYCDGCTDETEALARTIAASSAASPAAGGRVRVVASAARRGKPTGLNTLVPIATGELLLLNDVRQPLAPGAARALARAFRDPAVGCATGNLQLAGRAGSGIYWRYENWIRMRESRFRGVVGMTGPIGMIRRASFSSLPEDLILDDVWIPMQLARAGKRVRLVPEAEALDVAFEDQREYQRKVRTLAGNYQLFARLPGLLLPFVNPIWFETISHKVLRLIAPWLLAALAIVSLAGSGWFLRLLLVGQILFYGGAATGRGGKLASLARTFVVLNAAAVLGLWRYLGGRQRVTW